MKNIHFKFAWLIVTVSTLINHHALAQTAPNDFVQGGADEAMSAPANGASSSPPPVTPFASSPSDQGVGTQNTSEMGRADAVGDGLRVVTPFSPANQIPNGTSGGMVNIGPPAPGGRGIPPPPVLDGQ